MDPTPTDRSGDDADDAPPVLGSWQRVYTFVLVVHVLLLIGFYLMSRAYTLP
jgi:hypothetical protein